MFLLDARELRLQRLRGRRVQRAGLVDHMRSERWHGKQLLRLRTGELEQAEQQGRQ
ncbi:hypothetical protein SDC9_86734 [bioreactor metagenome]|uniref:Uncharacterized protein n=1 Tax=bioreactor metagenome TaxID=1076179 RepID=A0A644ZGX4_9ZZZZ